MSTDRHLVPGGFREFFQPYSIKPPKLILLHIDLLLASRLWGASPGSAFSNIQKMIAQFNQAFLLGQTQLAPDREIVIHIQQNEIARFYVEEPGRPRVRVSGTSELN